MLTINNYNNFCEFDDLFYDSESYFDDFGRSSMLFENSLIELKYIEYIDEFAEYMEGFYDEPFYFE